MHTYIHTYLHACIETNAYLLPLLVHFYCMALVVGQVVYVLCVVRATARGSFFFL